MGFITLKRKILAILVRGLYFGFAALALHGTFFLPVTGLLIGMCGAVERELVPMFADKLEADRLAVRQATRD